MYSITKKTFVLFFGNIIHGLELNRTGWSSPARKLLPQHHAWLRSASRSFVSSNQKGITLNFNQHNDFLFLSCFQHSSRAVVSPLPPYPVPHLCPPPPSPSTLCLPPALPPPPPPLVPVLLKPVIVGLCYSVSAPNPPCCLYRLLLHCDEVSRSGLRNLGTISSTLQMDVAAWPVRFRTDFVK